MNHKRGNLGAGGVGQLESTLPACTKAESQHRMVLHAQNPRTHWWGEDKKLKSTHPHYTVNLSPNWAEEEETHTLGSKTTRPTQEAPLKHSLKTQLS